jgi:hypothetical protein
MVARRVSDAGAMDGEPAGANPASAQTTALWIIAVLLAIIATCLVLRVIDGPGLLPQAQAQTARMGAHGIFAFTGQLGPRSYGLFMVDVDAGNVWCYEYAAEKGRLRLVAGRSFIHDRYLEEFNTDSPTPGEVAQLVDRMRAHKARQINAATQSSSSRNE